jgi:hypothetical protein
MKPCTSNKKSFKNKEFAISAIKLIDRQKKDFNTFAKLRAYECDRCGQWHLTSKEKYWEK